MLNEYSEKSLKDLTNDEREVYDAFFKVKEKERILLELRSLPELERRRHLFTIRSLETVGLTLMIKGEMKNLPCLLPRVIQLLVLLLRRETLFLRQFSH